MELQQFIDYCSAKKGTTKEFPFDSVTLVFKVMNKMYALVNLNNPPHSANLKCDPVYATMLREKYKAVTAGYHMSKKHWNTVLLNGDAQDSELQQWINDSYQLVVRGLTKKQQAELELL